ncbi:MAG: hypothetical protein K9M82_02400 [Deltaproteobacteria bacterium]|nr:hypothetical protein [Deltaproteobacteria bacterium]
MAGFEYDITKHGAEAFTRVAYFCSEEGECGIEEVPADQLRILGDILNGRGAEGWELVQLFFNQEGVLAFWKRPL